MLYTELMESIYNLVMFIFAVVFLAFIVGLIRPSLLGKLLGKNARRKHILVGGIAIIIGLALLSSAIEPASVKQARLDKEHAAQVLKDEKLKEQERKKQEELKPATPAAPKQTAAPTAHNPEDYWHKVTAVVDGDTVKASIDGKEQTIRIIGINAPESTSTKDCYGDESTSKAKEFLTGKWIKIESDKTQDNTDKYQRLLRYVYFDQATDFGKRMIQEGYAYEYTYAKPYKKQAVYRTTQEEAKTKSLGLWSKNTCDGQLVKPAAKVATPTQQPAQKATPAPAPAAPAPAPAQPSNCNPNYSPCVPNSASDLDCIDIKFKVQVIGTDVYKFDKDGNGYGCESYQ